MSIVMFFSSTVSLPLPQRGVACGDAKHGGPSLRPATLARGDGDLLLAHRLANCSDARRASVPPCESVAVTDLQARALVGDLDLERREAHHVDVGRNGDLRRLGFEARPQVESTAGERGDTITIRTTTTGSLRRGRLDGKRSFGPSGDCAERANESIARRNCSLARTTASAAGTGRFVADLEDHAPQMPVGNPA